MDKNLQKTISKDKQIIKFCIYGFLKNLQFFVPYLLIFLMDNGLTLLKIGVLFSIREIIINIFEMPSGFLADYLGRKKVLCLSFVFYIISFIFFFFSKNFGVAVVAMIFFGLGEAFRSGTHKAMIYTYLENKNWINYKSYVYGKTRSASLVGSAISSILSVIVVIYTDYIGNIFLVSIIPYILDFILISSYPKSLDVSMVSTKQNFKTLFKIFKNSIKNSKHLRHIMIGEGIFEATITSIKDYIQPIMEALIIGSGIALIAELSPDNNLKIILGIVYGINNIIGSVASKNAYLLKKHLKGSSILNIFYFMLSSFLLLLGIFIEQPIAICVIYIFIFIIQNARKPIYFDEIDRHMDKSERATILSVSSQLKSLFVIILAPLIGYIADNFGINYVMYGVALLLIILLPFTFVKSKNNNNI